MWQRSSLAFIRNNRPLVMAHRGSSASAPESTRLAFQQGYDLGVDCLETDAHLTKDGQVVLFHDTRLKRTTNGSGILGTKTLTELRALDLGYKFRVPGQAGFPFRGQDLSILTLEELLTSYPDVRVNIDLKDTFETLPGAVARVLDETGSQNRVMVGSFHQQQIRRFCQITRGRVPTSAGPFEVLRFVFGCTIGRPFKEQPPYAAFQVPTHFRPIKVVTPRNLRYAHDWGVAVHVWTINSPAEMQRLLALGVDGIFSDDPETLFAQVDAYSKLIP
ncbi:MAG TPA: glycerophosphodiester phosphodiesterase [Candidatus Lokiarchaeia archaeon]|nr:glycerophosphodiester phosphodiesterase [Candidatus Lokiarchaeia archaeon]